MLDKNDLNNILFFLNETTISARQAITMAIIQTKLTNMLKEIEEKEKIPPTLEKEPEVKVEEEIKSNEEK